MLSHNKSRRRAFIFSFVILICLVIGGCDSEKNKANEFISACSSGEYDSVISLLKQGISRDIQVDGVTCLMAAAGKGHADIVEKLLALNADTELVDNEGNTAFDYATYYKYPEIAETITNHKNTKQLAAQQQQMDKNFESFSEQDRFKQVSEMFFKFLSFSILMEMSRSP